MAVALAVALPAASSAATPPAGAQYDYDPIPEPGNNGNGGNNGGNGGNGGTDGGTGANTSSTGSSSTDSGSTTTPTTDYGSSSGSSTGTSSAGPGDGASGSGNGREGDHPKDQDREKAPGESDQSDQRAKAALAGAGGDDDSGGTSALLIIAIVVIVGGCAFVAFRRWRAGGGTDVGPVVKVAILALVTVGVLGLGAGKSLAAKAPKGFFGMDPQEMVSHADTARMFKGGIGTLRWPVSWATIQPNGPDEYDWSSLDSVVESAVDEGLQVLPTAYDSPLWVSGKPTNMPVRNAAQVGHWKAFLQALVDRYGPTGEFWNEHGPDSEDPVEKKPIRTWQLWNEPNFHYFSTPVSPANYAKLVKEGSRAIKAIDPGAEVMLAGLYGRPKGPAKRAMYATTYIKKFARMGTRGFFDSVALHPYTPDTSQLTLLTKQFRKVLVQARLGSKATYITEIGWGSGGGSAFGMKSLQGQAKQLRSAFGYLVNSRRKLNLKGVYWFSWKDAPRNAVACNFCYSTGLFRAGEHLKPKPAWRQFVKFSGGRP